MKETTWRREEIPYDAMGDYSTFHFLQNEEDHPHHPRADRERREETPLAVLPVVPPISA